MSEHVDIDCNDCGKNHDIVLESEQCGDGDEHFYTCDCGGVIYYEIVYILSAHVLDKLEE